jgi:hypothetical protein
MSLPSAFLADLVCSMRWLNSWNSSKAWFDKGRWKASMGSLRSRMFFTEASLLIARDKYYWAVLPMFDNAKN